MASRLPPAAVPLPPRESLFARLLVAPITFVSFLISLALIDNRNTSFRQRIHSTPQPSQPETFYGRLRNNLYSWIYRPQPYAYVRSPEILQRQKSGEIVIDQTAKDEPWHWKTKQRMMIKLEAQDAFEIRKRVVVAIAVAVAVFAALAVWIMTWIYNVTMNYFFRLRSCR